MQIKKNIMEQKEVIKLWKKSGYSHAQMEFSCGGDSMGDTEWFFYKNSTTRIVPNHNVREYFEEEVYKRVEFFEASDGVYMGESGQVEVKLNETGDDFDFLKSSIEEYNEMVEGYFELKLTEKEREFIRENVINLRGNDDDDVDVNFNGDILLSEEKYIMLKSITDRIKNGASDLRLAVPDDYEPKDWFSFVVDVSAMWSNVLTINVAKEYTIYRYGK